MQLICAQALVSVRGGVAATCGVAGARVLVRRSPPGDAQSENTSTLHDCTLTWTSPFFINGCRSIDAQQRLASGSVEAMTVQAQPRSGGRRARDSRWCRLRPLESLFTALVALLVLLPGCALAGYVPVTQRASRIVPASGALLGSAYDFSATKRLPAYAAQLGGNTPASMILFTVRGAPRPAATLSLLSAAPVCSAAVSSAFAPA